jgi:hypothetical protein
MEKNMLEKCTSSLAYVSNFFILPDTLAAIEKDVGKIRSVGITKIDKGYYAPVIFLWEGVDCDKDKAVIIESQWDASREGGPAGAYINIGFLHYPDDEESERVARLTQDFETYRLTWS